MSRFNRFHCVKSQKIIESGSDVIPLPRSGHRILVDEANLYLIGGYIERPNEEFSVEGDIWKFNFFTHKWTKLEFKDSTFRLGASHAAVKVEDSIIIHGGTGSEFGREVDNTLINLNLKTLTSYVMESKPKDSIFKNLPIPTYGHSLNYAMVNGSPYLYKFGGAIGNSFVNHLYRYDIEKHLWERIYPKIEQENVQDEIEQMYRHDSAIYDNKLYIFGGSNHSKYFSFNPVRVFDLIANKWSEVTFKGKIPKVFKFQSAAQDGHLVYMCGGLMAYRFKLNRNVYCYNLKEHTCSLIARQGSASYFHDCAFAPKIRHMYSFGGVVAGETITRTNSLQQFVLGDEPRRLDELAWQALQPILKLSRRKNRIEKLTSQNPMNQLQSAGHLVMTVIQRIEESFKTNPERKFLIQPSLSNRSHYTSSRASASTDSSWSGSPVIGSTEEDEETNQEDISYDIESEDRYSYDLSNDAGENNSVIRFRLRSLHNRNDSNLLNRLRERINNSNPVDLSANRINLIFSSVEIQSLLSLDIASLNDEAPTTNENNEAQQNEIYLNNMVVPRGTALYRIINNIYSSQRVSIHINDDAETSEESLEDQEDSSEDNVSHLENSQSTESIASQNSSIANRSSRPVSVANSGNSSIHQQLIQLQRWITAIRRYWGNSSPTHSLNNSIENDSPSTIASNSSTGATGGGTSAFADAAGNENKESLSNRNINNAHPLVTDEALVIVFLFILGVPLSFIMRIEKAEHIIPLIENVFASNDIAINKNDTDKGHYNHRSSILSNQRS